MCFHTYLNFFNGFEYDPTACAILACETDAQESGETGFVSPEVLEVRHFRATEDPRWLLVGNERVKRDRSSK